MYSETETESNTGLFYCSDVISDFFCSEKGWMLRRQLLEKRLSYFRLRFARMKSIE